MRMKNEFLEDVLCQPEAMRKAMSYYKEYQPLLDEIAALQYRKVLFCGMGSSHYCSLPAVIRLNTGGISARVESASEILYYEYNDITPDTLLILTSQSGESGEIVSLLDKLPASQTVIGITNEPDSRLGKRADICLEMHVEPEQAVSTRTYLASLILSDMVASALLKDSVVASLQRSAEAIDVLEDFLQDHVSMQNQIGEFFGHPNTLCYIGRGPALASAESGALFTRETAKYPALAFDSAEFRHGPFEIIDENFCAIVFAPEGITSKLQINLVEAISKHMGKVILITDMDVHFDSERILVFRHTAVPENYAVLVQIAAAQLFANDMALHLGHTPGVFRQSAKVTTAQ